MRRKAVKAPIEVPDTETLAQSILKLGNAVKRLDKSGMNKRAIIILLQHMTGLSQRDIKAVLNALPVMHKRYCA